MDWSTHGHDHDVKELVFIHHASETNELVILEESDPRSEVTRLTDLRPIRDDEVITQLKEMIKQKSCLLDPVPPPSPFPHLAVEGTLVLFGYTSD